MQQLRRNGKPSLCEVLPIEINKDNNFALIFLICMKLDIFLRSSVS